MEKPMKNTIAISGATGFVGKNLTKHFDQNKTKYISITAQTSIPTRLFTCTRSPMQWVFVTRMDLTTCHNQALWGLGRISGLAPMNSLDGSCIFDRLAP